MADALQISQSNYHKIESDKVLKIDTHLLLKIAQILETHVNKLLPEQIETNRPDGMIVYNGMLVSEEAAELLKTYKQIIDLQEEFMRDKEKINQFQQEKIRELESKLTGICVEASHQEF